jgi:predicted PurR-regulated permease PerM
MMIGRARQPLDERKSPRERVMSEVGIVFALVFAFLVPALTILGFVIKGHTDNLNRRIDALKDALSVAKDDYARMHSILTKQIELLTAEAAKVVSTTTAIQHAAQPQAQNRRWITELSTSTHEITTCVTTLSQLNSEIERSAKKIRASLGLNDTLTGKSE